MSRSLTLPDELFNKLAQGAAQRGLTVEALLGFVSELVVTPDRPTRREQERSRRIEQLLSKYRAGPLTEDARADLDRLVDLDFQEAITRADRLIGAKKSRPHGSRSAPAPRQQEREAPRPAKRSHK